MRFQDIADQYARVSSNYLPSGLGDSPLEYLVDAVGYERVLELHPDLAGPSGCQVTYVQLEVTVAVPALSYHLILSRYRTSISLMLV